MKKKVVIKRYKGGIYIVKELVGTGREYIYGNKKDAETKKGERQRHYDELEKEWGKEGLKRMPRKPRSKTPGIRTKQPKLKARTGRLMSRSGRTHRQKRGSVI